MTQLDLPLRPRADRPAWSPMRLWFTACALGWRVDDRHLPHNTGLVSDGWQDQAWEFVRSRGNTSDRA